MLFKKLMILIFICLLSLNISAQESDIVKSKFVDVSFNSHMPTTLNFLLSVENRKERYYIYFETDIKKCETYEDRYIARNLNVLLKMFEVSSYQELRGKEFFVKKEFVGRIGVLIFRGIKNNPNYYYSKENIENGFIKYLESDDSNKLGENFDPISLRHCVLKEFPNWVTMDKISEHESVSGMEIELCDWNDYSDHDEFNDMWDNFYDDYEYDESYLERKIERLKDRIDERYLNTRKMWDDFCKKQRRKFLRLLASKNYLEIPLRKWVKRWNKVLENKAKNHYFELAESNFEGYNAKMDISLFLINKDTGKKQRMISNRTYPYFHFVKDKK